MWQIILTLEILFWLLLTLFISIFNLWLWITIWFLYFISLITSWVVIVQPNTVRTKEVFGKYTWVLRQGFNLVIPFITITKKQNLFKQNFSVEVEWVTHDNVTAYVWLNVISFVKDEWDDSQSWNIFKSVYEIDDPRTMIRSIIDQQLRSMIVEFSHIEIFSKREELGNIIEENLREKLSTFGITLDSIQVRDVKLDANVMHSMNKIIETEKLKQAALNEAEAKKIMQVKQAEAEKESKILLWEGMAWQRLKIAEWFKESVDMIKKADSSLNAEKVLDFLLDSSRIETLWNIWDSQNTKLIYLNEDLEWRKSKWRETKLISWSDIM